MSDVVILGPVFKETIWGGNHLKEKYGFDIPSNHTGENWCISAHPHGDCEIMNGKYQGKTLSWLYENHRELFGNIQSATFPILVKWIDANDNLSVQVHPNDQYASLHENSLGKSECWYVVDCKPNTKMVMGHHAKNKEALVDVVKNDNYDALLNVIEIQPGDFYWIPSGTIHAICEGSLIYEVQQSSDITYRVYDYHRKDKDGKERELHISKSLDVIKVPSENQSIEPTILENGIQYLDNEFFKVKKITIEDQLQISNHEPMRLVTILEGNGKCNGEKIERGMSFIILSQANEVVYTGNMTIMETTLGSKSKM